MTTTTYGAREPLAVVALRPEQDGRWLEELLRHVGFTIQRADSGRCARYLQRASMPDLIVLGAQLRDASGLEVCRALRADPWYRPTTSIVIVTPDTTSHVERMTALRAGAWECIDAGSDREELRIRLDMWLEGKQMAERSASEGLLDPLTNLYNRQGLSRRARELASEASRLGRGLACVIFAMEIDSRAEPTAEQVQAVARRCAALLRMHVRISDALGRLVHCEFGVIVPVSNGGAVDAVIERLARRLEEGVALEGGTMPPLSLKVAHTLAPNLRYSPIDPVGLVGRTSAVVAYRAARWRHPNPTR